MHPTAGTFWGMGIGVGCGVGWGPGFGPEVIGYVGAGCGVGFSVGITLAGVGIGLPMNGLLQVPYNAFATSNDTLEFTSINAFATMKSIFEDGWNYVSPRINFPKMGASERPPSFKIKAPLAESDELDKINKAVTVHTKSTLDSLAALKDRYSPPRKGT